MICFGYTIHWILPGKQPRDQRGRYTSFRWSCYAYDETEALYKFRKSIGNPRYGAKNITKVVCWPG